MALPKTVSYVPFEETSFGYGSTELADNYATQFPNGDDIVKITIEHSSGNWDTTGHLSTPSSGTAVAVYNAVKEQLTIKGERDDVDVVLAQLSFFPADKPETRTWDPTEESHALKANLPSGNYGPSEEPPAIGDTVFSIIAYNVITGSQVTGDVAFQVTEAVFGNQRPYWSVAPTTEDLSSADHDDSDGGLVDFGTISHGNDTENVQVKCEFRNYGGSNYTTTSAYGSITKDSRIFIGDKKQAPTDNKESRFDFTGSVAEAQAFLDNVRYYNGGNKKTFDMYLTITDGVVGSTLTKTCYFSDALVNISTIPDVHYVEDANPAYWSFEDLDFDYSNMPEVDTFTATITLDATGRAGCSTFDTSITVDTNSYDSGTGVLTITDDNITVFASALKNLRFTPVADFNSAFTMTVDFTFSNPVVGSSYNATQQTVNVTAEEKSEVTNLTTTHTWTEDQWYDFPVTNTPRISHGYNHDFDIVFTLSDPNAGALAIHEGSGFFRVISKPAGIYKLSGTRDEVNETLAYLYFAPVADYDSDFTISFTVDRTSGDLTYETQSVGSMTMNAIAVSEISFPLIRPEITWENNVSTDFISGLQITDNSDTLPESSTFGSTYTVKMLLRQLVTEVSGVQMETGVLKISDDYTNFVDTVIGNYSNFLTITGSKDAVNVVLNNLTFIPDPLYSEDNSHYVVYEVTRDADQKVIQPYTSSVLTWIRDAIIDEDGYSSNAQLFDWYEDTPFEFDTKFSITEKVSENSDYVPENGYDSWHNSWYKVTIRGKYWDADFPVVDPETEEVIRYGDARELPQINFTTTSEYITTYYPSGASVTLPNQNLLVSGSGTVSDPLVLQGSKAELNKALATMKMTATEPDFTNSPDTFGSFWFEHKVERMRNNSTMINYNVQLGKFNAGTDITEYKTTWTNVEYIEDRKAQYIFTHLDNFIVDNAGDLFDVTYDVSIRLANETTGKFESYVEEGYLLDDELNIFVNDYEVRIVGSKADVNQAIKNIQFSPYADVNTNVDIHYTQKRTYNNSTVTHADDVVVTTMIGNDVPEYVLGTANNNIQYFVENRHLLTGVDTNLDHETIINNKRYIGSNYFNVTLMPQNISTNLKKPYEQALEITDEFEDGGPSKYRLRQIGGSLIQYGNTQFYDNNQWWEKNTLNSRLRVAPDSIRRTSQSLFQVELHSATNIPDHEEELDLILELARLTANGTETVIDIITIPYVFLSGITFNKYTNYSQQDEIVRFDNVNWRDARDSDEDYQDYLTRRPLIYFDDTPNVAILDSKGLKSTGYDSSLTARFYSVDDRYKIASGVTNYSDDKVNLIAELPKVNWTHTEGSVERIRSDFDIYPNNGIQSRTLWNADLETYGPPNFNSGYGGYIQRPYGDREVAYLANRKFNFQIRQLDNEFRFEVILDEGDFGQFQRFGIYAWTEWGAFMRFGSGYTTHPDTNKNVYESVNPNSTKPRPDDFPIAINVYQR